MPIYLEHYGNGVQIFDGVSAHPLDASGVFDFADVTNLHMAKNDTLWVTFRRAGVASYRSGFWRAYYHRAGLAEAPISSIHEDPDGKIWLSTFESGIFSHEQTHEPPETYIDAAPKLIPTRGTGVFTFSGRDAWDDTLKEHLLYSWRIVSDEADEVETPWSIFGSRTTAVAPVLPSGAYAFEVRASDEDRAVDATPASVRFRVEPPLWRMPGFLGSTALLGILLLYVSVVAFRALANKRRAERGHREMALFAELDPSPVLRVDPGGVILSCNVASTRVLGTKAHPGTPLHKVLPGFSDVDFGGCSVEGREFARSTQIGDRHYQFVVKGVPDLDLVHVYGSEITELKTAQEKTRLRQEQLLQADKMAALGTLVAGVAHEINNPNTYVKTNAVLFAKAWDQIAVVLDEYYEENGDFSVGGVPYSKFREKAPSLCSAILDGSERIRMIVQELRDFARVTPSSISEPVDVNQVILTATTLLSSLLKKSTDRFSLDLCEDLPKIKGSFHRLEQVIINVVQNSCQALPSRSSGVFVSTLLDAEANEVHIVIRDEGEGISEDDLIHLTEPFFTTKHESSGTGLGMSISSSIIQDHGGALEFESELGKGTSVTIRLPIPERDEDV